MRIDIFAAAEANYKKVLKRRAFERRNEAGIIAPPPHNPA